MALRFLLKKTCFPLATSGALFHASAPAAAAAASAARPISEGGVRTLSSVGVVYPSPAIPNYNTLSGLAARYLSSSPCPHAAASKISSPRTGMPSININHMESARVDSSRGASELFRPRQPPMANLR